MNITNENKNYMFTLFTTLARGMIEIFIPIYLYNFGFSLAQVFEYFLYVLLISFFICYPLVKLGEKIKYKHLIFISTFFIALTYILLMFVTLSKTYLLILALVYSLYRRTYWIGKRYFALNIIPKKNMGNKVSIIVIITQIASMLSAYLGALILNNIGYYVLFVLSILIYSIGVYFLFNIEEEKTKKEDIPIKILKKTPISNLVHMSINEVIYICSFVFPIYLYLYVKNNFEYLGIFNIFVGISSIVFIYFFSKKMDKDKKDYKIVSYVGLGVIFLLKVNIQSAVFVLLLALFEGVFFKMQEVAFTRNVYYWGSHFNKRSYNLVYELIQNGARALIFLLIILLTKDLKIIIYICSLLIIVNGLIPFDDGKGGYI